MKPLSAAQLVLSISVIVLALIQLTDIWANAIYLYESLLGAVLLIQAVQNWNKNRLIAYSSIVVGVLLFGTTVNILLR